MSEQERPRLVDEATPLVDNRSVGGTWHLATLHAPEIARRYMPGQFVHVRIPGMTEHMLRRPFSVFDVDKDRGDIDVLYGVQGFGTEHLSTLEAGANLDCEGPIGNFWHVPEGISSALLVGNGAGVSALFMLAKRLKGQGVRVHMVFGAPSKDVAVETARTLSDALDGNVDVCTADGAYGGSGDCASHALDLLHATSYDFVACSASKEMPAPIAHACAEKGIPCQVWLGSHMGCGVGACLGCVMDTTRGRVRVCVDGPIFDAKEVIW